MHLLSSKQIVSSAQLNKLFLDTDMIRKCYSQANINAVREVRGSFHPWGGKVIAITKDESSTRTRVSFEVAVAKLGGSSITLELDEKSSINKGESIEDTIRTLAEQVEAIVIRLSEKGLVERCSKFSRVPVINAGDGDGEHPTQGLLDVYTILKECGRLDNLDILVVGDLKHSRTVHSLLPLLNLYKNNFIRYVSAPDLTIPEEYKAKGCLSVEYTNLDEAIEMSGSMANVIYMTRQQKERHGEKQNSPCMKLTRNHIEKLNANCKVLHALPKNDEIPEDFNDDPRVAYWRQVENGVYVRMALLDNLFRNKDFFPI